MSLNFIEDSFVLFEPFFLYYIIIYTDVHSFNFSTPLYFHATQCTI